MREEGGEKKKTRRGLTGVNARVTGSLSRFSREGSPQLKAITLAGCMCVCGKWKKGVSGRRETRAKSDAEGPLATALTRFGQVEGDLDLSVEKLFSSLDRRTPEGGSRKTLRASV